MKIVSFWHILANDIPEFILNDFFENLAFIWPFSHFRIWPFKFFWDLATLTKITLKII
jgi:hypothetical protein